MEDSKLKLEVFSDYVCPWCYLSTAAVERLQREYPVEITWCAFPLHPGTPEEGLSLDELFQGHDMSGVHRHLEKLMRDAGLDYEPRRHMTYNSRLAQELAKWAETRPGGQAIHQALFRAYFVHTRNLARAEVLLDVAESVGLDRGEAARVLEERRFRDAVDADWQRARQLRISGVPSFLSNGLVMTGCQPYPELERFVKHLAAQRADITAPAAPR